jgi:hypothetical protein
VIFLTTLNSSNSAMEIKKIFSGIFFLWMVFASCANKQPTLKELAGTWVSEDGAVLELNEDSSFVGKMLPAQYFTFFIYKKEIEGKKINGSGKWKLQNGSGFREVNLNFVWMDGGNLYGNYSVLISGEGGIFKNKPPWYLFLWREEEGGERYKFHKQ